MNPTTVAAIDLGSNTVRLLVASAGEGGSKRLLTRQEATRLGQGLTQGGLLDAAAADRTLEVLRRFKLEISAFGVNRVLVGATMAVRQAGDGQGFMARVRRELGFEAVVLTGRQEAELTAAGVMTSLRPVPRELVIFDLGGRSTEFVLYRAGRIESAFSLGLGAVSLTEGFLASDPPSPREMRACRQAIGSIFKHGLDRVKRKLNGPALVAGTAGTVTTLAAMAQGLAVYQRELVDNFRLTRAAAEFLFDALAALPVDRRRDLPGLPADRADIMVAGTAVVLEVMDFFRLNEIKVSDSGLLEGLWLVAAGLRSIKDEGK
ncbi:MAG: Ppx/GppA phosphatase family protein [Pseudomonadota bacterium]